MPLTYIIRQNKLQIPFDDLAPGFGRSTLGFKLRGSTSSVIFHPAAVRARSYLSVLFWKYPRDKRYAPTPLVTITPLRTNGGSQGPISMTLPKATSAIQTSKAHLNECVLTK